jgi:hypothetical protein
MGGRYYITGVQLGILIAIDNREDRAKLINEIIDKQFISDTSSPVVLHPEPIRPKPMHDPSDWFCANCTAYFHKKVYHRMGHLCMI